MAKAETTDPLPQHPEEKTVPHVPRRYGRRAEDLSPHDRIDGLEDRLDAELQTIRADVSTLREESAFNKAAIEGVKDTMNAVRDDISHVRTDVIATFGKLFMALILVIIISIGSISALVGGTLALQGWGASVAVGQGASAAAHAP